MKFLKENLVVDDILFHRDQFQKGDRVQVIYSTSKGERKFLTGTITRVIDTDVLVREDGTSVVHRYPKSRVSPEYVADIPNLDTDEEDFNFLDDMERYAHWQPTRFRYPEPFDEFDFDDQEVLEIFDIGLGTDPEWDGIPDDETIDKAYLRIYFNKFCALNGLPNTGSFYKYCISRDFDTMFFDELDNQGFTIPTNDDIVWYLKDHQESY